MAKKKKYVSKDVNHPSHQKQEEHSYEYVPIMYDNLPYFRDSDICNPDYLASNPSRVYRYYIMDTDNFIVKLPKQPKKNG